MTRPLRLIFLIVILLLLFAFTSLVWAQDSTITLPDEATAPTNLNGSPSEGGMQVLEIGDTVEGTLSEQAPSAVYGLAGHAGDIITITMTSDAIDSYLLLGDSQGSELLIDDDSGHRLDARIGPIKLPDDGSYVVVASSFNNVVSDGSAVETGDFTISVNTVEAAPLDFPGHLETDLTGDAPFQLYSFTGQAGDVVLVHMDSDDFDPYVTLSEADNIAGSIVSDDDSGKDANALIGPVILPATGSYYVTATSSDGDEAGEYDLKVEIIEPAPFNPDEEAASLTKENPALVLSFDGAAGETVDISVTADGNLDTTLTVLDPDGMQLAYNDDADGFNPGLVALALPTDGTYVMVVKAFVTGNYGELRVALSHSAGS
jgi:hypothetical protein